MIGTSEFPLFLNDVTFLR